MYIQHYFWHKDNFIKKVGKIGSFFLVGLTVDENCGCAIFSTVHCSTVLYGVEREIFSRSRLGRTFLRESRGKKSGLQYYGMYSFVLQYSGIACSRKRVGVPNGRRKKNPLMVVFDKRSFSSAIVCGSSKKRFLMCWVGGVVVCTRTVLKSTITEKYNLPSHNILYYVFLLTICMASIYRQKASILMDRFRVWRELTFFHYVNVFNMCSKSEYCTGTVCFGAGKSNYMREIGLRMYLTVQYVSRKS